MALYPQPGAVVEQAAAGNLVALEDLGFDIPALEATFGTELLRMVADGSTLWCIGTEAGGATRWAATDWLEEVLARIADSWPH